MMAIKMTVPKLKYADVDDGGWGQSAEAATHVAGQAEALAHRCITTLVVAQGGQCRGERREPGSRVP